MMHGITSGANSDHDVDVTMRFWLPADRLRDLITSYYEVVITAPPTAMVADLLHPEWGNLRFQLRNAWHALDADGRAVEPQPIALFGPTSRARPVEARPGAVYGVGFTPLGWATLIRRPASEAADLVLPATDLVGDDVMTLHAALLPASDNERVALIDRFFLDRAEPRVSREAVIRAIHAGMIDRDVRTVEQFAAAAGLTPSALGRACLRDFGFTPKILLRRQRFLRTLAALGAHEDQPIGELLDGAYVDHSHFNREFKRFMGLSPSEYLAQPRLILRAAAGQRERALGAALQGLHALD